MILSSKAAIVIGRILGETRLAVDFISRVLQVVKAIRTMYMYNLYRLLFWINTIYSSRSVSNYIRLSQYV